MMEDQGRPLRVLLIEDNPGDARLIREMLLEARAWPFAVQHAGRLSDGLELAAAGEVDVVLLDLGLPDSQGLETFLTVHARAPQIPVIVLTGLDDEAIALRALHDSAQDYLTKTGLEGGQLARAIRYAVERKQAERAVHESAGRLRAVMESAPIVVFATDREGTITLCQGSGLASLAVAPESVVGRAGSDVFANLPQVAAGLRRALAGEMLTTTAEVRGVAFQVHLAPERDAGGVIEGSIGVAIDVTERTQAESRLQRTIEELQEKTVELESFTYSVSHDLKEPLRTIEAFSQFLMEDCADGLDEQAQDYLARMSKASARLRQMIEELLVLARLGERSEEPGRVDVGEVVAGAVDALQAAVAAKRARIEVDDALPAVQGDRFRTEQIFGNLLGNALKFNQAAEPLVRVGVRSIQDGTVVFYVQDNGIGIDPEYHGRVFGVFQQLHRREEYEGTGAGLAIVKRAALALGGDVRLDSHVGQGATFLVTLPIWGATPNVGQAQAA